MKQLIYFVLALLLFQSCDDPLFQTTEEKLVGSWTYEKVKFLESWSISSDNLSSEYEELVLELRDDFSFEQVNQQTGDVLFGTWFISENWNYRYDETYQRTEQLHLLFSDTTNCESQWLLGDQLNVTKNRIRFQSRVMEGTYRFKLVRD